MTAAEVAEAVRHLRYPPAGDRGVATYNRACRLGVPFQLQSPTYLAALERVRGAAERHGKACGLLVGDGAAAAARHAEGWAFVGIASDTTLLAAAVAGELARARPSTPDTTGGPR
jgi:2-dehydro-3-deoxyglucarate aldolase/4-hydroxy-2-oxoheptanedioate aldolase